MSQTRGIGRRAEGIAAGDTSGKFLLRCAVLPSFLRSLFSINTVQRQRWPFALRAALCMGTPILVGWLLGETSAGMMAALGGFTSLYGSGRPYVVRARLLAIIAVAFGLAVALGMLVASSYIATIVTLALIAAFATWICNAARTGPPGAYMFVLACAAGSAIPAPFLHAAEAAMLVTAGGAFAWVVHMAGALWRPRGPEQDAVRAAANAVVDYLSAEGEEDRLDKRHVAAIRLHDAWTDLASHRRQFSSRSRLTRLRAINRELHLLFADAMTRDKPDPMMKARAEALTAKINRLQKVSRPHLGESAPLGRPGLRAALRDALRPDSRSRRVILRVGVGALLAGTVAGIFGLERAYWAVTATVLVLHQGFDWLRMLQRGLQRIIGTLLGLALAAIVLEWQPQGFALVLTIMVLQFCVELTIVRNYALGVFFITGAALVIATGGQPVDDPNAFLLARAVDTIVGCALGAAVFWLIPPRPARKLNAQMARTLEAIAAFLPSLAKGEVASNAARVLRRNVQTRAFALEDALEDARVTSLAERELAERLWPAIAATQDLAYQVISTAWGMENLGEETAANAAATLLGESGERQLREFLLKLAAAIRTGQPPPELPEGLPLFAENLRDLRHNLASRFDGREKERAR